MSIEPTEINAISQSLLHKHGQQLMDLVTMVDCYRDLSMAAGPVALRHFNTLMRAVVMLAGTQGVTREQWESAQTDLLRSRATVDYLLSLPD